MPAVASEAGSIRLRRGGAEDTRRLVALFDDAVAWMVARGQTAQWGAEPFSALPAAVARAERWASGGGLWFAVADEQAVGALVVGEAPDYVPPADRPELYVVVLLTASAWRRRGVGARLIEHAVAEARARGAERVRVDCWDGVPELPAQYERLGFTRIGGFDVRGWPGAILSREV